MTPPLPVGDGLRLGDDPVPVEPDRTSGAEPHPAIDDHRVDIVTGAGMDDNPVSVDNRREARGGGVEEDEVRLLADLGGDVAGAEVSDRRMGDGESARAGAGDIGRIEENAVAGYWRIAGLLDRYGVSATFSSSGRAIERNPWLARDALDRGHEVSAHGWRWEGQAEMEEAAERDMIARTARAIEGACGKPPVGWHTKSSPSVNTRRLLVEHGGFTYDSDAYDDDLPYVVEAAGRSHVVLPYACDTNDMRFQAGRGFDHAEDFARYCIDAFEWLWEEGERTPRMMSVGLHLRIIGRPGRIAGLDRLLAAVTAREGVWIARRDAIARHWRERMGIGSGRAATP